MGPGVITSRTLASMMSCLLLVVDTSSYPSRYLGQADLNSISLGPALRRPGYSPDLRAAEQAVESAADLLGERGVGAGGQAGRGAACRRDQRHLGLADQAAVQALDLAESPDQVHAGTPGAGLELSGPLARLLARRADQDQLIAQHATAPGALPSLRVRLPHAAAVTRQSPRPPSDRDASRARRAPSSIRRDRAPAGSG